MEWGAGVVMGTREKYNHRPLEEQELDSDSDLKAAPERASASPCLAAHLPPYLPPASLSSVVAKRCNFQQSLFINGFSCWEKYL